MTRGPYRRKAQTQEKNRPIIKGRASSFNINRLKVKGIFAPENNKRRRRRGRSQPTTIRRLGRKIHKEINGKRRRRSKDLGRALAHNGSSSYIAALLLYLDSYWSEKKVLGGKKGNSLLYSTLRGLVFVNGPKDKGAASSSQVPNDTQRRRWKTI